MWSESTEHSHIITLMKNESEYYIEYLDSGMTQVLATFILIRNLSHMQELLVYFLDASTIPLGVSLAYVNHWLVIESLYCWLDDAPQWVLYSNITCAEETTGFHPSGVHAASLNELYVWGNTLLYR